MFSYYQCQSIDIHFLTLFFAMIIYLPNPTFVPSLSEIGDLSSIISCLVLPGFLMDTLLKGKCLPIFIVGFVQQNC